METLVEDCSQMFLPRQSFNDLHCVSLESAIINHNLDSNTHVISPK